MSAKSFWCCGAAVQGAWGAGGDSSRKNGRWGLLLSRKVRERLVCITDRKNQQLFLKSNNFWSYYVFLKINISGFTWGFFGSVFERKVLSKSLRFSGSRNSSAEGTTRHSSGLLPSSRAPRRESSALVKLYLKQTKQDKLICHLKGDRRAREKPVVHICFSLKWEHEYSHGSYIFLNACFWFQMLIINIWVPNCDHTSVSLNAAGLKDRIF